MSPAIGRPARKLIYLMMILVLITVFIAQRYYRNENLSVDPRIVPARELYEQYNSLAVRSDYEGLFTLLDSIKRIYNSQPHYYGSFETGVLENNRAAVYLTIGLSYDSISTPFHGLGQDSIMALGESAVRNSIAIYEGWMDLYSGKTENEIRDGIRESFMDGLEVADPDETSRYLDNRVKEIEQAIEETPRRLSVSYTNLGIVYRYRLDYESAAIHYRHALELWEDNLTAENNLNLLLGKPPRKRTFIEKMFPNSRN
jgi:tetratricopeptide (TPR) repeat protein